MKLRGTGRVQRPASKEPHVQRLTAHPPGHNGHLNLRAYVNHARGSNTFQVFTFERLPTGAEVPAEAAFDAVVSC